MSLARRILGGVMPRARAAKPAAVPRAPIVTATSKPVAIRGRVVETYTVPASTSDDGCARVFIADDEGFGFYRVEFPNLSDEEADALDLLKYSLENSIPVDVGGDIRSIMERYLWESATKMGLLSVVEKSHKKLLYYLMRDSVGFAELDPLLNDDGIEEISLTRWDRPVRVWHRRHTQYHFMETSVSFTNEEELQRFVRRLAQLCGDTISIANPVLEAILKGPSDRRVTATLGGEVSLPGSTLAIRKQKADPLTVTQLVAPERARAYPALPPLPLTDEARYDELPYHKTLTALMVAYFWLLMERTTSILICGETFSGKTTLMNALLALVNPRLKVVTVEDVPEINLPGSVHWQRLMSRPAKGLSALSDRYEIDLEKLLKVSLRFSPDMLCVGEVRGAEAATLSQAIAVGHSTMSTIHGEDAKKAILRLSNPPMNFTVDHIRALTAIATMNKITLADGSVARRLISVDEVEPLGQDSYNVRNVFTYHRATDSFEPATPQAVLERSYRLKELTSKFEWSYEHILRSLASRAAFVAKSVEKEQFSVERVSAMVREYVSKEYPREVREKGRTS